MRVLSTLREAGVLSPLDVELALSLTGLVREDSEPLRIAIALASRATREGHVCADLRTPPDLAIDAPDGVPGVALPELTELRAALRASALVTFGSGNAPLVLDASDRLYLRRYWEEEVRLARALTALARDPLEPVAPEATRALLSRLFPPRKGDGAVDAQELAAQIACCSRLSVITGGPGTGKTTTVARILALSLDDARRRGREYPRALLLAPTGKAAARLAEAVTRTKPTLDCDHDVLALVPEEARTIHRALEAGRRGFRIDAERPLFADVVVVDEASMIDVSLMRRLVEAVPRGARLVLLGDKNQLSSVEAGAVLSDLAPHDEPRYSRALDGRLARSFGRGLPASWRKEATSPVDDCIVHLSHSRRFSEASALGRLALAIQRGDAESALRCFEDGSEVSLLEPGGAELDGRLAARAVGGFRAAAVAPDAAGALAALSAFRVLCAHRTGPVGVERTNDFVRRALVAAGLLGHPGGLVHPLLVQRNAPELDLWNGDVGVLFSTPDGNARAVFGEAGSLRALSPSRLPPHEPAFAMSVHKSQGSEFDVVAVVLPAPGSPLLTRELLYTAVTRARKGVVVHATRDAIREAVGRRVLRASGLGDALRGPSPSR